MLALVTWTYKPDLDILPLDAHTKIYFGTSVRSARIGDKTFAKITWDPKLNRSIITHSQLFDCVGTYSLEENNIPPFKRDGHLGSISAHGKRFIKSHDVNPNCQLDIVKLDLYKSRGK